MTSPAEQADRFPRLLRWEYVTVAIGAASSLFFLYTAAAGSFVALVQRSLLLMSGLVLVFLERPLHRAKPWARIIDVLCALAAIGICSYLVVSWRDIVFRAGEAKPWDWYLAAILVILIFEASRRTMGLALPILASLSLAYAFLGPYIPGALSHRGFSPEMLLSVVFLTTEGIWGVALGVGADVIIYFIIFAGFLAATGATDFFLELANSVMGRVRGGPAKIAVVASGLFGTISGSAPANVAGTGSVTIPLMKRTGYQPAFAGAVEAVASSGGQIMPPIMGSAAFIMAEILGISYLQVAISALIPALLYYLALMIMVDLEAKRVGLKGLEKSEVPEFFAVLRKGWPLLIPLFLLVYLLVSQYSPGLSAFYSLLALIVFSMIRPETRLNVVKIINALANSARDMAPISVVCAVAGIIIGVLSRTSLGPALAELLVESSGGSLPVLLFLTMCAALVLGMGMPTVAAYILLAMTVAPALVRMGVEPLAAHMFVFYFGIISAITPPVAIASYTAAGIAGTDLNKVSWVALRLGLSAFILPYMFIYGPELLLISSERSIAMVVIGSLLGIFSLSVALQGYLFGYLNWIQRALLFLGALGLIDTGSVSDLVGGVLFLIGFGWHYLQVRAGRKILSSTPVGGKG